MKNNWLSELQSTVLAPRCLLCHAPATPALDLCPACRTELPWQRRGCIHCGLTLADAAATASCKDCLRRPRFDSAIATFEYQPPIDWLITRLKFHGRLAHARLLGTLMAATIAGRTLAKPDYILPVPLHNRRYRERGYNQAELLAKRLAFELAIPMRADLAKRQRHTPAQMSLPAAERQRNMRDAFVVSGNCSGHDIAIVDDVVTTGYTAAALTAVLRRSGAANVRLWCVARA